MYQIQILLPVQDEHNEPYPRSLYSDLARDLTTRFGEFSAYTQSSPNGYLEEGPGRAVRQPVMIYEVMAEALERPWWAALRERLEIEFAPGEPEVRAHEVQRL